MIAGDAELPTYLGRRPHTCCPVPINRDKKIKPFCSTLCVIVLPRYLDRMAAYGHVLHERCGAYAQGWCSRGVSGLVC